MIVIWLAYLLWARVTRPRAPWRSHRGGDLKLRNALLGTAVPTPLMLVHLMSASGMPSPC